MNKSLLLLCTILALPAVSHAGVTLDVNVPGVSVHIGERDTRGYYWDGYDWRPPQWWRAHQGHYIGERNNHGMYWYGNHWERAAPPAHYNASRYLVQHPQGRGHGDWHDNGQPIPPNGHPY